MSVDDIVEMIDRGHFCPRESVGDVVAGLDSFLRWTSLAVTFSLHRLGSYPLVWAQCSRIAQKAQLFLQDRVWKVVGSKEGIPQAFVETVLSHRHVSGY